MKNYIYNILLLLISVSLTFWAAETIFRKVIFGTDASFSEYRNSIHYAQDWDDNFWKLQKIWYNNDDYTMHPIFGWAYRFHLKNYIHPEIINQGNRRPVLFYGDSFTACVKETTDHCWEDIMNSDSLFSKNHYLFNYGVGAHGVDQIYSVFTHTYLHYPKPIVLLGFMISDLDRSILTIRESQKPQYKILDDGSLFLDTTVLKSTSREFIIDNPPTIKSYLFRRFLFSPKLNFLPKGITQMLTGETAARKRIIELNTAILKDIVKKLRSTKTDFLFVIFNQESDYKTPPSENWRINFVKSLLDTLNTPYYFTLDAIKHKIDADTSTIHHYFIPNDGHPTPLYNEILSKEFTKMLIEGKYEQNSSASIDTPGRYYISKLDSIAEIIKKDSTQYVKIVQEAQNSNKSTQDLLLKKAFEQYWEKY